jgi:hypothetical protein
MNDKPLSPELRFLVEAERTRPDAPASAQAQAEARLTALLGPASGLAGGGGVRGSASPSGTAATPGAETRGAALPGASALPVGKLLAAFALGGLAGGATTALVARPSERVVYVDRPVSASSVARPLPTTSASPEAEAPPPAVSASGTAPIMAPLSAPSASSHPRSRDTALAAERALIERARSALARGDAPGALLAIAQHQHDFPAGQLSEEREALAVQALVAAGRTQEASQRGARFRSTFPNSLLLPLVDQALR